MRYLVVIPAYNEADKIAAVIEGVLGETSDIVVVDDGSTDSTRKVLAALPVKITSQPHRGKGAALKAGFRYAIEEGYDWVITMDGDGQHDSREISNFVKALSGNGTDMVLGSRMSDTTDMPAVRFLTNKVMSGIISGIAGHSMPDTQCGFRAIRCDLLKSVTLDTNNYDTESELLIKAARKGFRITSTPVSTIYNDSQSSINKFTDTLRFIRLILGSLKNG